eukprot:CAMPEP_0178404744 /NCGR_PEP_ID=MMETSP0689_2-20121128/18045_1 /TAXON_ID=160604 /ORGANISM="Amphidinium massartii, Strain CS-259" /LENGTH=284 /DNA_ID=CAMNT_0020025745 /DNA_START=9 /DNA_END=864 /DNA_ORIENTATION=+
MQLDYRGTFATASYLPAPASKNSMPELKITASDGQVTVQELHNILNFVTSALLVESAREGVRLTCDLRSLSLPPTHVTSALVDLLAEFGRQHQALLQEKLVVRKVCVPPGSRFRVAKQILDLLFAACPPTKCTYLVTNLDDIMPEEVAVFGPVHEHGECVTTQDSSYAALLKHHWRRRGSVEKPLKLRRRDRLAMGQTRLSAQCAMYVHVASDARAWRQMMRAPHQELFPRAHWFHSMRRFLQSDYQSDRLVVVEGKDGYSGCLQSSPMVHRSSVLLDDALFHS